MADIGQAHGIKVSMKNNEASTTIAKYRVAVLDTSADNCMKLPSGASSVEKVVGATIADVTAGYSGTIVKNGIVWLQITGAAVVRGDTLVVGDASGRVMAKPSGATTQGIAIVGVALESASTEDNIIAVELRLANEYSS